MFAAVLGWLLQVARRSGGPDAVREELLALAVTIRGLALAGALDLCRARVDGLGALWEQVDAPTREGWERDRLLLNIAGKVCAKRREAARQNLAAPAWLPRVLPPPPVQSVG